MRSRARGARGRFARASEAKRSEQGPQPPRAGRTRPKGSGRSERGQGMRTPRPGGARACVPHALGGFFPPSTTADRAGGEDATKGKRT